MKSTKKIGYLNEFSLVNVSFVETLRISKPKIVCQILTLVILIFFSGIEVHAQKELPPDEADKIETILSGVTGKSVIEQINALAEATTVMRSYTDGNPDLQVATRALELEHDRLMVYSKEFKELVKTATSSQNTRNRKLALHDLRLRSLNRAANMMQMLAEDGISADEASGFLKLAKEASRALDDLKDVREFSEKGSFKGAKSGLSKFITIAKGIVDLKSTVDNPDANNAMNAFKGLLGSIVGKANSAGFKPVNPLTVFEYPAKLTGAQIGVVNKGFEHSTNSMSLVAEIIGGNDTAEIRKRLAESNKKLEKTLSRENFGRAMLNALLDPLLEKFPFLKKVKNLDVGQQPGLCELKQTGIVKISPNDYWNKGMSPVKTTIFNVLGMGGGRYPDPVAALVTVHPEAVNKTRIWYRFSDTSKIGAGTYNISVRNVYPNGNCGNLTFEPQVKHELIVKVNDYYGWLNLVESVSDYDCRINYDIYHDNGEFLNELKSDIYLAAGRYRLELIRPYDNMIYPPIVSDTKIVEIKKGSITEIKVPKLTYSREGNNEVCKIAK